MGTSKPEPSSGAPESSAVRLDSWKEIAAYLKRDERTVRRWEQEGLPVHRHVHKKQASIYAYKAEVDAWWNNGRQRLEPSALPVLPPAVLGAGSQAVRWNRVWFPVLGVAVLVAGALVFNAAGLRTRTLGERAPAIRSIAVLPLENLSRDPEQEYFADGMTEELVTELGKIGALRVISRTSVMRFKRTREPLPQIARELGVDALVEGTILRTQDRVRVTANLVQASPEKHLWAQEYERDLRDELALQSEVANAIARQIRVTITPAERQQLAADRPANPAAYEAYLKGRFHWNKRTEAELKAGIDYFNQAVAADPRYALAYVGLADSYNILGDPELTLISREEARSKAMMYTAKALEIDDRLGEAHTSLAMSKWLFDWDRNGAEQEFKKAITLSSNYANAHHWYAELLSNQARFDESVRESYKAKELDPLSPMITEALADRLLLAGRNEQAVGEAKSAVELDPSFPDPHMTLAYVYRSQDKFEEAIRELKQAVQLSGNNPYFLANLGYMYAMSGDSAHARETLRYLQAMSKGRYTPPYNLAVLYAGLGEKRAALESLQRAADEHSPWMNYLYADTRFDDLRSDLRFTRLLLAVGFQPKGQPDVRMNKSTHPTN